MKNGAPTPFPKPPECLASIPRSVLQRIDAAEVLLDALGTHSSAFGASVGLRSVRSTLVAARIQQQRIRRAQKSLLMRRTGPRRNDVLFFEVHFYLICWARIHKLTTFVAGTTGFPQAKLVLRRYRSRLAQMSSFRDQLEHFEERLPGGSRHQSLRVPSDLFNMRGDSVSIGGDSVDIGTDSLRLLTAIVAEFEKAVAFDGLNRLWSADQTSVARLVRRAALLVQIPRVTRRVRKTLKSREASRVIRPEDD